MSAIIDVFHTFLTQPLLNALIWLYNFLPGQDIGFAIISLTLLVRLILFPSFHKSLKSQRELQKLQPKLNEIREKHKGNKEEETKAILEFYKTNKVNPLSSCLPLLVQLPILIALFQVFRTGLNGDIGGDLYAFVSDPGIINTTFLGIVDLAERSLPLALLAGAFQFIQTKMIMPKTVAKDTTQKILNTQLTYFMPLFTVFIAASLQAGLALYWTASTVFAIFQQLYIIKKDTSPKDEA